MGNIFLFQMFFHERQGDANLWMTFCSVELFLLIAVSGYHCCGKQKYFLWAVLVIIWALIEFLVFLILAVIPQPVKKLDIMGEAISKILMIIFVYAASSYLSRQNRVFVPNKFFIYSLIFPIGSIYISFYVYYTIDYVYSSIVSISILLVFNTIIFEFFIKMNVLFRNECDNAVYTQQMELISGSTVEQKRVMEEFYKEKHDLTNALVSLRGCIEEGDLNVVMNNLDMIIHNYENEEKISTSGNSTVDAIINFKYAIASELEIEFQLNIFIPNDLPIDTCDIGVVLGNAIDNAIEAVKECRSRKRVIEISMGIKKEACVIVIKNPYENKVQKDNTGMLISTKKEKHKHGYGIKSIMKIADKYQGEALVEEKDDIFSLIIVLNFGEF